MRNLKKFLALVLAMIMVVGATAAVSADFTDVAADNQYAAAINDLAVKKIIAGKTETTFAPDEDVQRFQMALLVARATTGIVDNADWANGIVPFADVTADHFKGAISYAFVNGIIKGRDDVTFDPTGNIEYQDALTMAVRALGFNDLEYPWGFYGKAVELGLTDGITTVDSLTETLTRAETAQIIYNMIYVERENGLTLAAELFDLVVTRTTDLFVISCTPKQTYAVKYEASTNKNETFVGIQPLVNGVPNGEVIYLTTEQLGIEKADVEKYFSYAVELINYDAKTGKFDDVVLGDAPDLYRNQDVTYTAADATFTVAGKKYDAVSALTNNVRRNEFVAIAGETFASEPAKMLLEDENGQVYNNVGAVVAQRVPFSGETIKYYAVLAGDLKGTIVNETVALGLWGFTTDKVEYAQYATLTAASINALGAYQLQCFDDNKDGTYDRVFAYKVYMSVYNTSADGKTVYDIAAADSAKTGVTFSDPSVQVKGTVYVYTYNQMANIVNVIETVKPQVGTLQLIDATLLRADRNDRIAFYIDGNKYTAARVKDTSGADKADPNWTVPASYLGAHVITNADTDGYTSFADIADKGAFDYTDAYPMIKRPVPNTKVNFYAYGKNSVVLFVEEVQTPAAAAPAKNMIVTAGGKIDIDATIENVLTKIYKDGVLTDAKFDSIKGEEFAKLNIIEQAQFLMNAKEIFFPGIIYKTTVNADGEYAITTDANFNPYLESNYYGIYEFKTADVAKVGDKIEFKSGITTAPGYTNKIFTDKDTVFYFIDRTANELPDNYTEPTVDGALTKVSTFIGGPVNASIEFNSATRVFVDKIGLDGFADVVIVYDAAKLTGFGHTTAASSYVYVPYEYNQITQVGTAAALGLTDAKYAENNYFKYANAAIDLQTGAKVTIITTEMLTADNTNKIYKLDANNVVIEEADAKGAPLADRTSTLYMSLEEAVKLGVLETVENAVLTYVPIYGFVELHANNVEIFGHEDNIKSAVAIAQGVKVEDANIFVNDKIAGKIDGNETVYYLATGTMDGSIVVIYK